jgi:multidrug resistance efflux pump
MKPLPKIPSPVSHHWREFRHKYLPAMVFLVVLTLAVNLWNHHVAPPSIVGEVETVRTSVTATVPGEIAELKVGLLEMVTNGTPIAIVNVMDDDTMKATMKAQEADLLVLEERLDQNNRRNVDNYENLRITLLTRKVDRAMENANLQFAISEFNRVKQLLPDKTVSQAEYDLALSRRDALQEKVNALDKLIAEMTDSLERLRLPENLLTRTNASDPITKAIAARWEVIQATAKPQVIKAPMDGVVSVIWKRKGEKVVRGDAIVVISTKTTDRIVAYVRQPLNIRPEVGDMVEVRSRSFSRPMAMATIMKVGTQLEPINPAILPIATPNQVEYGLPLLLNLPTGLKLMPGETVDITRANNK